MEGSDCGMGRAGIAYRQLHEEIEELREMLIGILSRVSRTDIPPR